MQALAKRANIAETEVIDFIIDGMGNSVPNIQILMMARTLEELKTLANRHQHKFTATNVPGTAARQPSTTGQRITKGKTDAILCFNCSRHGHMNPTVPIHFGLTGPVSVAGAWAMTIGLAQTLQKY